MTHLDDLFERGEENAPKQTLKAPLWEEPSRKLIELLTCCRCCKKASLWLMEWVISSTTWAISARDTKGWGTSTA